MLVPLKEKGNVCFVNWSRVLLNCAFFCCWLEISFGASWIWNSHFFLDVFTSTDEETQQYIYGWKNQPQTIDEDIRRAHLDITEMFQF